MIEKIKDAKTNYVWALLLRQIYQIDQPTCVIFVKNNLKI